MLDVSVNWVRLDFPVSNVLIEECGQWGPLQWSIYGVVFTVRAAPVFRQMWQLYCDLCVTYVLVSAVTVIILTIFVPMVTLCTARCNTACFL